MASRAVQAPPPTVELLESRELLTAGLTAWLDGTTLHVEGTGDDDIVRIRQADNTLSIDYTLIQTPDQQMVKRVSASLVSRVDVRGRGGNELVHMIYSNEETSLTRVLVDVGSGDNRMVIDTEEGRWQEWLSGGSKVDVRAGEPHITRGGVTEEPLGRPAPTPAPAPILVGAFQADSARLLSLINDYRASLGLDGLRLDRDLTEAATYQAEYMASTGVYSHENADGRTMVDRVLAAGYHYEWVGEVLHRYNPENRRTAGVEREYARSELSQYYLDGWKASPSHDDILRVAYTRDVGIGMAQAGSGMIYAAVVTGHR